MILFERKKTLISLQKNCDDANFEIPLHVVHLLNIIKSSVDDLRKIFKFTCVDLILEVDVLLFIRMLAVFRFIGYGSYGV